MEWAVLIGGFFIMILLTAIPIALLAAVIYLIWKRVDDKQKETFEQRDN